MSKPFVVRVNNYFYLMSKPFVVRRTQKCFLNEIISNE